MTEPRPIPRTASEFEAEFRESRIQTLISVNLKTYWSIAIIVAAFGIWDYYVDPVHWGRAFAVRVIGAAIVTATGLYQNLPDKARWLPLMAKLRLVVAANASIIAAAMLDRGYGFGVAGLIVIFLTGPYVAIDSKDLLRTNLAGLATVVALMMVLPLQWFDVVGTIVFVALAVLVSTLLGRVLETSHRRAFMLELEQHRDARTDSLTGLANRRAMQERGRIEMKRARRANAPVSVILADLDHFKSINDRFGHETGDAALFQVARLLREALRESDALGRWGGEEFMVILPGTDGRGATEVAERMRKSIAAATFDGVGGGATISLGVASSELIEDHTLEWDLLIKEADRRLYRAKNEGRNRVVATGS
jgi:diguanylate cyclase (GGDEF)-like protein